MENTEKSNLEKLKRKKRYEIFDEKEGNKIEIDSELTKNKKIEENEADKLFSSNNKYLNKAHPFNLIYLEYLEKMRKTSKTIQGISMIKKAINSIKQYPMPIINHQQFHVLEGIGNYLGSQLGKLIDSNRLEKLGNLEEYELKCKEYRILKIGELNSLVDPILDQNTENNNSLTNLLEKNASNNVNKIKNASNPQIYSEKWCILVCMYLLINLKKSKELSIDHIKDLCQHLRNKYEPRMNIKKIEKSIKQLSNLELILINTDHLKIEGFPIESERKRISLSEKGILIAKECCKSIELFDYILLNCNNNDVELDNLSKMEDKIALLDKRRKQKILIDYDIVMLIDYREISTKSSSNYLNIQNNDLHGTSSKSSGIPQHFVNRLKEQGIKIELKNLPIGDIIWVARPILKDRDQTPIEDCFVLPWIIERKTGSDMCSSIIDGRYEEQKYRLMRSLGAENIIFLLEDLNSIHEHIVWSSGNSGPISSGKVAPKQILRTAQVNTQLITGFHVIQSQSIGHTLTLLIGLHQMIINKTRSRYNEKDKELSNIEIMNLISICRPIYKEWESKSKKSFNLTVQEVFGRQLRSIKGCGPEATEILLELWPTPYLMYEEILNNPSIEDLYNKIFNKWTEIRNIKYGNQKRKSKSPITKDLIHQIYNLFGDRSILDNEYGFTDLFNINFD